MERRKADHPSAICFLRSPVGANTCAYRYKCTSIDIRAIYTSMSYLIRRVLLDEMCRLYGKFASYLRRVLCKMRLIFPGINGPIVSKIHTFFLWRDFFSLGATSYLWRDSFCWRDFFFFLGETLSSLAQLFPLAHLFVFWRDFFPWGDFFRLARLFFSGEIFFSFSKYIAGSSTCRWTRSEQNSCWKPKRSREGKYFNYSLVMNIGNERRDLYFHCISCLQCKLFLQKHKCMLR